MIEEIKSSEIAHDIMYGSSPRDMKNRAAQNEKLKSIAKKFAIIVKGTDYVKFNLMKLVDEPMNDFYSLGYYTAHVALLAMLSKNDAVSAITEINSTLGRDNLIYMINQEFLKDL